MIELTKRQTSELLREFKYISPGAVERARRDYSGLRAFHKNLAKRNEKRRLELEAPDVSEITLEVKWSSQGNARGEATVVYADGKYGHCSSSAGGGGYDRQSTVIANILNQCCLGMLWRRRFSRKERPYGINLNAKERYCYFMGGVGTNCYKAIAEFLGGRMEHLADTKYYDLFHFKFKTAKQ